jgi:hypothetical protein
MDKYDKEYDFSVFGSVYGASRPTSRPGMPGAVIIFAAAWGWTATPWL